MITRQLRISYRSIVIAAALVGVMSVAIGDGAVLNEQALDAAKAFTTEQKGDPTSQLRGSHW